MAERRFARIPDKMDLKLAVNADLNRIWREVGNGTHVTPAERISLNEALVVGTSRFQDEYDRLPQSTN